MNPLTIDDLGSIQGDILINGFPKKAEIFCFFTIRAAQAFCQNIQKVNIATGKDIKDLRRDISQLTDGKIIDVAKTNIAFTSTGLTKLGNFQSTLGNGLKDLKESAPSFFGGMQAPDERRALGDPEFREWNAKVGSQNGVGSLDGVLIVAGIQLDTVKAELEKVKSQLNAGGEVIVELGREVGEERHAQPGHEHFGFNDGISHPQVIGINGPNDNQLGFALDKVTQPTDLSNSVDPGIIVVGRRGDKERASSTLSGVNVQPKPTWAKDGSFLVFRKLEQHVDKWNKFVLSNWQGAGSSGPAQFGAQLMGRWQSGKLR
jgi:deferrochelatase/peroxidase EfeB